MSDEAHRRSVRSYVRRGGRITRAQKRALAVLWPRFGIDYAPRPLDLQEVFGRQAPCILEIGFGNGKALTQLARENPQRNYLGVEVHQPGVGSIPITRFQHHARNRKQV